jgi:nicotinamidase-related amidase
MAQDEDAATIKACAPGGVGLLIIDMINDMAFPEAEALRPKAERITDVILALRDKADRLKVPVVYVNDNYGQWHSEKSKIVEACSRPDAPGRAMVRKIAPRDDDYFVIKPQFSGFYATNLPVLLPTLGVNRLVITGIAADICVLFTAADAHMRAYDLWVPIDAVASEVDERAAWALTTMEHSMDAHTMPTSELSLEDWLTAR